MVFFLQRFIVSVLTTIFSGFSSLGLAVVMAWFISEFWAYHREQGHAWLAEHFWFVLNFKEPPSTHPDEQPTEPAREEEHDNTIRDGANDIEAQTTPMPGHFSRLAGPIVLAVRLARRGRRPTGPGMVDSEAITATCGRDDWKESEFRAQTMEPAQTRRENQGPIRSVSFSPDGKLLVVEFGSGRNPIVFRIEVFHVILE